MKSIHNPKYKKILKKLKLARIEAELTQEQVSKLLGWGQSVISKIERADRRLDVLELLTLADLYEKDILYFIDWE